ncbi:hypothetical protein BGZ74_009167 [Mortierella antarctica]|nr:hypothetical protein BGZ74_009167 [Mortierella antarctica]
MTRLLPEIIHQIGVSIPLFTTPSINGTSFFAPQDLVACTLVCRTWYNVLTPLLWRYFDDREEYFFRVPLSLLQDRSRYFRYLTLTLPISCRESTLLRELVIHGEAFLANMALLHNNPQLPSLSLHLEDDIVYREIQPALDKTSRLRTLRLSCGKHPNINHLVQFISNNTELRKLEILKIVGFDHFDMSHTPMLHLTELRLDTRLDRNPGLVDLIRQCPSLEAIWFHAWFHCPAEAIARNIRECCPHLTSIRCLDGTSFRFTSLLLCESEILLLMACTTRHLVHFEMEMVQFTSEICHALLTAHAQHLEMVHIYVHDKDRDTLVHGGKVLAACKNLKSFALAGACNAWTPKDGLILLEQPWKSSRMEAFWLDGIWYNAEGEDDDGDYEDFFEPDPDDLEKERESVVEVVMNRRTSEDAAATGGGDADNAWRFFE